MERRAAVIVAASGFSGLGLQIVWTQQGALALGHEAASMLAVVTAFFGGLSLGAFAIGGRIARSSNPGRAYAICEAVIGAWALVLAFGLAPLSAAWVSWLPPSPAPLAHWAWIFAGTFLWLLPATAAMGATLPTMERALAPDAVSDTTGGGAIAPLYAANTFGAVLGALGAAFMLVPFAGLRATALVCALANFGCALAAARRFARPVPAPAAPAATSPGRARATLALLALTGLLGIAYEVLVVRALSQVAQNTVYTFAILLSTYLVGTTIGAATQACRRPADARRARNAWLAALALTCVAGTGVLAFAADLEAWLVPRSFAGALAAETLLALGAFLPATVCMGALFSQLATAAARDGTTFARALGVNTLGAASAPLLCAGLLVAGIGLKALLLGIAALYLLAAAPRAWPRPPHLAAAATLAVAVMWLPSPAHVYVPDGGRIVRTLEGPLATVGIVADAGDTLTLHIDNKKQEGSSATVFADARQGVLPLLLHPHPRRALFLGLGTGITSRAASAEAAVDAVELLPEVIDASAAFATALPVDHPPRLIAADARRFVRDSRVEYDVIVADNFHPARSGSGTLYTVEHFRAVRGRLAADGVFCQWLPLHQLDLVTLRSIVRSYLAIYPHGSGLLATNSLDTPTLGLVSTRDGAPVDARALAAHLSQPSSATTAARFGLPDELAVLGAFVAGPASLARFAGDAPLNTDDRPVVAYSAPRVTYAPDSTPRERLFALLDALDVAPVDVFANTADASLAPRMVAYWRARNRYLAVGRDVQAVADVRDMVARVREPLLGVLRISPDFRPAYDPLLNMASALVDVDPAAGRQLLRDLALASPARAEAAHALGELDGAHAKLRAL